MMKKIAAQGLLLGVLTLLVFFGLYIVCYQNGYGNYYVANVQMCSFLLPLLYVIFGFWAIAREKKQGDLTFPQAFRASFLTMLVGGVFSFSVMYLFLHQEVKAKQTLIAQGIATFKANATQDFEKAQALHQHSTKEDDAEEFQQIEKIYHAVMEGLDSPAVRERDYVAFLAPILFPLMLIYYLMTAAFLSAFFRRSVK